MAVRKMLSYLKFEPEILPKNWNEFMQLLAIIHAAMLNFLPFALLPVYVVVFLRYPQMWLFALPYFSWIYFDSKVGFNGGRRSAWCTEFFLFRYLREYFSARVIKTADLPPDRNYLMIFYPHSLMAAGPLTNFLMDRNRINELFPGIDMRFVTLNANLYIPIMREHMLAMGGCSCDEKSLLRLLDSEPSKAVIVLPGGATEAGTVRPGRTYTIIRKRKGFVRVALKSGVPLVPVVSFNEHNLFDRHDFNASWIRPLLDAFHKYTGLILIVPKGRGLFQSKFGLLPRKVPLNAVVGQPIYVPKVENPSPELIDEYHEKFFTAFEDLFEKYKEQCDIYGKDAKLVFL